MEMILADTSTHDFLSQMRHMRQATLPPSCPPCPAATTTDTAFEGKMASLSRADAAAVTDDDDDVMQAFPSLEGTSATVRSENLFGDTPDPSNSSGTLFRIQGRGADSRIGDEYVLCSFTRVCAQNDRLLFVHHDPEQAARWKAEWREKCWKVPQWQQPPICACFHSKFLPDFLTPDQMAAVEFDAPEAQVFKPGHFWSMHKW